MHRQRASVSCLALLLPLAGSARADRIQIGWPSCLHVQDEDGDRLTLRLTEKGRTIKVDARGAFELDEAETDLTSLEPGGRLRIEERRRGRVEHKIEMRGLPGDQVERTYWRAGKEMPLDAEGRAWLAEMLGEVLRNTTLWMRPHLERVVARSGPEAALAEIEASRSDHGQRVGYETLLELAPEDSGISRRVAASAAATVESDHELALVLSQVAERSRGDEAVLEACAEGSRSLDSDYERRRALFAVLTQGHVGPRVQAAVARSAAEIDSDHERAEVLVALADTQTIDPAVVSDFFAAVDGLDSDYERRRTLVSSLAHSEGDPAMLRGAARSAAGIDSAHERAEVLIAIANMGALDPSWSESFFAAAADIGSDFEQARALAAVLRHGTVEAQVLRQVLACAATIDSDYHKAQVLLEVVDSQPQAGELGDEIERAARTIDSSHHRTSVLERLADRRL